MANWYKEIFQRDDPELRAEVGRLVSASRRDPTLREAGAVVEFVREGRLLCGAIRGRPTNRVTHILVSDGREVTVRVDKIVLVSGERVPADKPNAARRQLGRLDSQRDWASRSVDVAALWEVARDERGGESDWGLEDLSGLYYGASPQGEEQAALLRALWRGEWFVRRGRAWRPLSADAVAAKRGERRRRRRAERHGEALSAWLRRVADGQPEGTRPEGWEEAVELLEGAALHGGEAPRAAEAADLMKGAHLHGPGAAREVLVQLGHWSEDENLALRRSGAPLAFGEAAAEAAATAAQGEAAWPALARRGRRVWLGRPVGLVAEGEHCLLAAGVQRWPGGWRATVYIPALSRLVPAGSQLDEEARTRGESLLLPDRSLPLVPESVLALASLGPDRTVPCLAVEAFLSRDFALRRCNLRQRRVRVRRVWRDGDEDAAARGPALDLVRGLRRRRLAAGAVIFPSRPRPRAVAGAASLTQPGDAALALEEWSLLASAAAGRLCQRLGLPAVYRVQPDPVCVVAPGAVLDPVGAHLQARALSRTVCQTEPGAWASMGLEASVPVAAPAGTYLDLIMQRQLLARLAREPELSEADLRRAVEDTAAAREAALEVRRSARRYWLLKFLEGEVGRALPALVLERAGLGYVVELEGTGCRDYVPVRDELAAGPGERIAVKVEQVSARRDILRLSPFEGGLSEGQPVRAGQPGV